MSDNPVAAFLQGFGIALAVGWAIGNALPEVWVYLVAPLSLGVQLLAYAIYQQE